MNKLADAFISSAVIQGLLTLILWGAIIYLSVVGEDVPPLLAAGGGTVITFWFKTKTENKSR